MLNFSTLNAKNKHGVGKSNNLGIDKTAGPKMKIFDSHCHLDDRAYDEDLDRVLARARSAGVNRMMTIGVNHKTSSRAIRLAESHPGIYASVGVHPHDVINCSDPVLKDLAKLTDNPAVRAWGEIGLDFNRMYSPREDQERWFRKQLRIASELELPMIFHERDSHGRFLELLKAHAAGCLKGVVHCFSGNQADLEQYLDLGLLIGITGIVTMQGRGSHLRRLVPLIPADRLLIETDAPYLVPHPENKRFRRNEPAFVKSVLFKLAEVREEDPEKLAKTVWDNTCRLYNLDA